MEDTQATDAPESRAPWCDCKLVALQRLPLPYGWTTALLLAFGTAGQVVEYILDVRAGNMSPDATVSSRLVFLALLAYILMHFAILRREALLGFVQLRPAVLVPDAQYDARVYQVLQSDGRIELSLLAVSAAAVAVFFWLPPSELLGSAQGFRAGRLMAAIVSLDYVLLGWLLLSVVYTAIRFARGLGVLAGYPLSVNVFDPLNLLPFGRLSLLSILAVVGMFLIPLILLGPPTRGGYVVIPLSVVSLLALFLPLWGVHRQMQAAKNRVFAEINQQLMETQGRLLDLPSLDPQSLGALTSRTNMAVSLRNLVLAAPGWPFRNEAAIVRAAVAALSPLVYFILNQLIQAYLLPALRP